MKRTIYDLRVKPLLSIALLALAVPASPAADFSQWRGPLRDGHSPETGLLQEWPKDGPKLLWQVTEVGRGLFHAIRRGRPHLSARQRGRGGIGARARGEGRQPGLGGEVGQGRSSGTETASVRRERTRAELAPHSRRTRAGRRPAPPSASSRRSEPLYSLEYQPRRFPMAIAIDPVCGWRSTLDHFPAVLRVRGGHVLVLRQRLPARIQGRSGHLSRRGLRPRHVAHPDRRGNGAGRRDPDGPAVSAP